VEELVEETDFPQRVNGVEFLPGMQEWLVVAVSAGVIIEVVAMKRVSL